MNKNRLARIKTPVFLTNRRQFCCCLEVWSVWSRHHKEQGTQSRKNLGNIFLATSHEVDDVSTPVLMSLLVCWRNSTPFFGIYALCTTKIGNFSSKVTLYGRQTLIEDKLSMSSSSSDVVTKSVRLCVILFLKFGVLKQI